MSKDLRFDDAYAAIEAIVKDIENEHIPVDELAAKVKEARQLIAFCEARLGLIEAELSSKEKPTTEA